MSIEEEFIWFKDLDNVYDSQGNITIEALQKLLDYRHNLLNLLHNKKIDTLLVGHKTFLYMKQNKLKKIKKAHGELNLIFNYIYFMGIIERKISYERELNEYGFASETHLFNKLLAPRLQRDKVLKRFFVECPHLEVQEINSLPNNTIEIIYTKYQNHPFYMSKKEFLNIYNMKKLKHINCLQIKEKDTTMDPLYYPYINFFEPLKIFYQVKQF